MKLKKTDGWNFEARKKHKSLVPYSKILSQTDNNDNSNFDNDHKISIDDYVTNNFEKLFVTKESDTVFDKEFSLSELDDGIKNLKYKSAPEKILKKSKISTSLIYLQLVVICCRK